MASNRTRTGGRSGGGGLCGVLLQKRGVPTGYLEAKSLKRTRGFSDPHRRQERRKKARSKGLWQERGKLLVLLFGFLAGIPDLQRIVITTTDNSLAIRAERHAIDSVFMSRERL